MDQTRSRDNSRGFSDPASRLSQLDPETANRIVTAACDFALLVDQHGVVQDVAVGDSEQDGAEVNAWVGRQLVELVTPESRQKAIDLVAHAGEPAAQQREINHVTAVGVDLPVRYSALRLGQNGDVIVLGRDLRQVSLLQQQIVRSQQAMEREYARLRAAETRYRMLFQLVAEPIIVLDAANGRVVEANKAAQPLLARGGQGQPVRDLASLLSPKDAETLRGRLAAARLTGSVEPFALDLGPEPARYTVSASSYRLEARSFILLSFSREDAAGAARPEASRALEAIERLPDGFVLTQANFQIVDANRAFIDLCQVGAKQLLVGTSLGEWLGRAGIDLPIIEDAIAAAGELRPFATVVRGRFGVVEEVEVTAVAAGAGPERMFGFLVRSMGARAAYAQDGSSILPRSVEQMADLVGRVPLKELVRETTDLIEKLCVEAALNLARDNRAAAAQMLGLSRQSFYAKMRRYGLGNLDGMDDEE